MSAYYHFPSKRYLKWGLLQADERFCFWLKVRKSLIIIKTAIVIKVSWRRTNGSLSDRDSCILRPVPFGGMEAVQDENYPSSFRARVFVCGVVVVVGTSDPICSKWKLSSQVCELSLISWILHRRGLSFETEVLIAFNVNSLARTKMVKQFPAIYVDTYTLLYLYVDTKGKRCQWTKRCFLCATT